MSYLLGTISRSWDQDNLMKNKLKHVMKPNSQSNTILIDEIGKKKSIKKKGRKNKSIKLTCQTCDSGYETGTTQ
jgi:hypothetical protein